MAIDLPVVGQQNWGEPLNASLRDMDVTRPGSAGEAALALKANTADVYSRAETGAQITNAITTSRPILYGTGFPNGKVAAPVGALYADEAVNNGASLWQKVAGTGNTGWVVVRGDTGRRNIESLLFPAFTIAGVPGGYFTVERNASGVTYRFSGKTVGATSVYANLVPPISGFSPEGYGQVGLGSTDRAGMVMVGVYDVLGQLMVRNPMPADTQFSFIGTLPVSSAWPATLPGTN